MGRLIGLLSFCILISCQIFGQPAERRITRGEYIDTYKEAAVHEMMHSGIPASITLAQGILESGDGNSPLAVYAKNHFGIKCHSTWSGKTFILDDDEKDECFRKYNSVDESFRDHTNFLVDRSRYAFLFELKSNDYKGWAMGLKKAGYATNPKYAHLLIALIEQHDLNQYDTWDRVESKNLRKSRTSKILATNEASRIVKLHNNIKYILVRKRDNFGSVAREFGMKPWQLYRYNDLNKKDELTPGEVLYLQPKRNSASEEYHKVKEGDTMRGISQTYGIKLKKLYKKNNMIEGTLPSVGQLLYLKKRNK